MIPVYKPSLGGNEIKYVNECLTSGWISSRGVFVNRFENEFAKYIDVKHSLGVCNGTVALHLALVSLGIGPGDEVLVPAFTYIASVNAIKYTGAVPVLVDSDRDTWQISVMDAERKITAKTKAVMAVHLYGHPCNMEGLCALCARHNIFLVEDCAEAFGSKFDGRHTGTFGDIATFSFYGNKTITTGEGGMVVTNNQNLYEKSKHLNNQGVTSHKQYWHDVIGYNYRMTNICAAIGLAQLEQADAFISRKRQIARIYTENLSDLPVECHPEHPRVFHSFWMFTIMTKESSDRDKLRTFLYDNGIETRPTFFPAHTMPMYLTDDKSLKTAELLGERGINLPSYPALSDSEVMEVAVKIREFFGK